METPNRDEVEEELAAAVLLLWLLMDDDWDSEESYANYTVLFNTHVAPIVAQLYGRARQTLAGGFGLNYPAAPGADGQTIIRLPNLAQTLRFYAQQLWDTLFGHFRRRQEAEAGGAPTPDFSNGDADRIAVTTTTEVQSTGEADAAIDVERVLGQRLIAIWRTEPGACHICTPLEGQTERVWSRQFPGGPPAHPNCRCSLDWRPIVG
jgi:hypothetical protein